MPRIPFPDPATLDPALLERQRQLGNLNISRMMLHHPELMEAYCGVGVVLLRKGKLDPILREILILRIGGLCRSDYEWHQHVSVSRAIGMPAPMLAAIVADDWGWADPAQAAALRIVEEIQREGEAGAEAIAAAEAHFTPAQIVEICVIAGFYIMTAGYLRSLAVDLDETLIGAEIMAIE